MDRVRSSAEEHRLHTAVVTGSIPVAPTIFQQSTTHKGDVAELLAAAELLRRGYRVSRPLSNGTPYDLIVDDGTRMLKVQVKKASPASGSLRVNLSTSKYHRGRSHILYDKTCDVVIAVDCDRVAFYGFAGSDLSKMEMRLRTTPTRNNQAAGVRSAEDYELSRIFPPI